MTVSDTLGPVVGVVSRLLPERTCSSLEKTLCVFPSGPIHVREKLHGRGLCLLVIGRLIRSHVGDAETFCADNKGLKKNDHGSISNRIFFTSSPLPPGLTTQGQDQNHASPDPHSPPRVACR